MNRGDHDLAPHKSNQPPTKGREDRPPASNSEHLTHLLPALAPLMPHALRLLRGLAKVAALYLAGLRVALRSIVVLLALMLALVAMILLSVPQQLFSANDVPKTFLALVYGDGSHSDILLTNLNAELESAEVIGGVNVTTLQEAEEQLADGSVDAIIILPDDILDVLLYGGHTTIKVQAKDALVGSIVYSVGNNAVGALEKLQNYALIFMDETYWHFETEEQRDDAANRFVMVLLTEALKRLENVETLLPVSPYYVQVLTLLMFVLVSIASFFVAVIAARQYASGYIRHLYSRGVRYRHLLFSQLLLAASISLLLGIILAVILSFFGEGLHIVTMLFSSVLLSLVLTALYLMFSGFKQQPQVATTRTLIGCLAMMFFLLFAGGGFYPTGLMQSDLRLFNPTWLSNQLAIWALGGPLNLPQLAMFVLPFALACAVGYLEWRQSL